jgi:uncharacterized alpha-E superfamily protein
LHALCDGLAFMQQLRMPSSGLRGLADDAIERLLLRELCSGDAPNSLLMSLQDAHRAASVVRDRISRDTWHVLSQLNDQRAHMSDCLVRSPSEVPDALDDLILSFGAFAGLQNENLSRTFGFRFMDLGRRIERAYSTALLIQTVVGVVHSDEHAVLSELLDVMDNGITYRRRYRDVMQVAPVLDLLLTDESNPRSIVFQLAAIQQNLQCLPHSIENPLRTLEERIALAVLTHVRLADVEAMAIPTADRSRPALVTHLARVCQELPALSNAVTQGYLAHAVVPRAIGIGAR